MSCSADITDLIERARNDRAAFNELLGRYRNFLARQIQMRFPDRLRDRLDGSDVVQETLLDAYQDFSRFRGCTEVELVRWLRAMLLANLGDKVRFHFACCRDAKREKRGALSNEDKSNVPTSFVDGCESPSERFAREERSTFLVEALEKLSPQYREIILQRNFQRRSFIDIARDMNRTPDAVRMLWARAIEHLRSEVQDDVI